MATSVVVMADGEARLLEIRMRAVGGAARIVRDGAAALRACAETGADTLFGSLAVVGPLLPRLRELEIPPAIFVLATPAEARAGLAAIDPEGAVLLPVDAETVLALGEREPAETTRIKTARLRELFEISLLAGDFELAAARLCQRVARAFHVDDAILLAAPGQHVIGHAGPTPPDTDVLAQLELAMAARVPLHTGRLSIMSRPLDAPGAGLVGGLCLCAHGARRFSAEERAVLDALARRAGGELAIRAAHARLAADHDRLRQSAIFDRLLGVLTRPALQDALAAAITRARGTPVGYGDGGQSPDLSIALCDIDGLRQVNEQHGHLAGDAALAQLAGILRAQLRAKDVAGRAGGDELAVIFPGTSAAAAGELLQRLVATAEATRFVHGGHDLVLRVRAGVAPVSPADDAITALRRAAAALAQAKQSGGAVHVAPLAPPGRRRHSSGIIERPRATRPPPDDALPTGTLLGGMYKILHELSQGSMGVVYRGEDVGLRRPVAIKVLRADLAHDAELVARFRDEAATLAAVRDDNLVQVHAFATDGDLVFFVMELVEGESLAALLTRHDSDGHAIPAARVAAAVLQIAGALDAMHAAGVIHRDVKPANILVDRARERMVLVDVGAAHPVGMEAMGTPGFAAPEALMRGDEGPGTDVYGLAATAYMLLTHVAPFGGGDAARVLRRQLGEPPAPPSRLRAELSRVVDDVLAAALRPARRDRPGSAGDFARALASALTRSATQPPIAPPPCLAGVRGIYFRAAYRILGNRLGSAWLAASLDAHPELAAVLRPTLPADDFADFSLFQTLVRAVPHDVRDPLKVALELGRAAMGGAFHRFLGGAHPGEGVGDFLARLPEVWPNLHGWGRLGAVAGAHRTLLILADTPREPIACRLVAGSLERLAELAGGHDVRVEHEACESLGAPACTFEVTWRA